MFRLTSLYDVIKNTIVFYIIFLKKWFFLLLGMFKKIHLLNRHDFFVSVEISPTEFPKNSWRIRRVVLELNINEDLYFPVELDTIMTALHHHFPTKKIFVYCKDAVFKKPCDSIGFLNNLNGNEIEFKLKHCLQFSYYLCLDRLIKKYSFMELYQGFQPFSKRMLNIRLRLVWSALIVLIVCLGCSVFFRYLYQENVNGLDQAKEWSQRLIQSYDNTTLSDTAKFRLFQEYYLFSNEFLRKNTSLTFLMSKKINTSMHAILFAMIKKQYSQKLFRGFELKLMVFKDAWQNSKSIRGEYYANFLAYLDLLYPDHIFVPAIDLQVQKMFYSIIKSPVPMQFIDDYLYYLKEKQLDTTVLVADDFFVSIKKQLQDDGIQNFFTFIQFLEKDKLGYVPLDYFFNKSDILMSDHGLPAVFLKDNFLNILVPDLQKISENRQAYAWFMDVDLLDHNSLLSLLKQAFITADKKSWSDFLSGISIRPTNSLLLANNFLQLLQIHNGDFKQLVSIANENLNLDHSGQAFQVNWKTYDKLMGLLSEDNHYLLLNENLGLAAKQYAIDVLSKGDTHLNQAEQQVQAMAVELTDPTLAIGLRNYLLAPVKFYWLTLLVNAEENIQVQYQRRVLNYYQQHLQYKFPFANTPDDADPSQVKEWLAPHSGLFWKFLREDLKGFVVFHENWICATWLDIGLPMPNEFINKVNQLWQLANDLFQGDNYQLNLSLYPLPLPAIENESLTIADKVFSYQNGPQTWQSFNWQPAVNNNLLTIQYVSHDAILKKEFKGYWGLLRFLLDPGLDTPSLGMLVKPENLVPLLRSLPDDNELTLFDGNSE